MERRNFFKNIIGASVLIANPEVLIKAVSSAPTFNLTLRSETIYCKTRKLKAYWDGECVNAVFNHESIDG